MFIGMEFSQDLRHIDNAAICLAGSVFKSESKTIAAKKLWNSANMQLKLSEIDLSLFKFNDDLSSDYLDHSDIDHRYVDKTDGADVPEDVRASLGCHGFAVRATVVPLSGERGELLVTAYLLAATDIKGNHKASPDPRFPGILVAKEQITLGLRSSAITDSEIPTPICPVFITQTASVEDAVKFPSTEEVLGKMSALLRKVSVPETKIDHAAVWRRWGEITANGENNLKSGSIPALWPEVALPDSNKGWS